MIKPRARTDKPAAALLAWYDANRRVLPWRAPPGRRADPYAVWLSEIMLQQTTVVTVSAYYEKFLDRWPCVEALAAAPLEDVLAAWAGLGYYARARNLHACALMVVRDFGGRFPSDEAALLGLPGVGPYTAAAIAAIAFDAPCAPVDGNVERVVTRLYAIDTPPMQAKPLIREKAQGLLAPERPGDFAQAMMDLGATLCTPRSPDCGACPLADVCVAHRRGAETEFPVKLSKKPRPARRAGIFILLRGEDVLLRRAPATGLFGGMPVFPSTPLTQDTAPSDMRGFAPCAARWRALEETVAHVFTHFALEAHIFTARLPTRRPAPEGIFAPGRELGEKGLPTLMRKAARLAGLLER